MRGLIQYTVAENTPAPAPYQAYSFYSLAKPWATTLVAADVQNIYLKPYDHLDHKDKSNRSLSTAISGVVEILYRGEEKVRSFSCSPIVHDRTVEHTDEFAIYEALLHAADKGVMLTWYPDVDGFPLEYAGCILKKRINPTRLNKKERFKFSFELQILSNVQFPATIPAFV